MNCRGKRINTSRFDPRLADLVPQLIARSYCILPLYSAGGQVVVAVPVGGFSDAQRQEIQRRLNLDVLPYDLERYSREEIQAAIEEFYKGRRLRIGEHLLLRGVISEQQLAEALGRQAVMPGKRVGEILRELGHAAEDTLQAAYAAQIGYRFFSTNGSLLLEEWLIAKLPWEIIHRRKCLPIRRGDSGEQVYLLTADLAEEALLASVRGHLGIEDIEPALVVESELERLIESCRCRALAAGRRGVCLGDRLVERGLITRKQLEEAVAEQRRKNVKLGELLVANGLVPEAKVLEVLAEQLGIDYLPELPPAIPPDFRELLTEKFTTFNKVVPVAREGRALLVAMTDPEDRNLVLLLQQALQQEIRFAVASPREIARAIQRLYHGDSPTGGERIDLVVAPLDSANADLQAGQACAHRIVERVNRILVEGIQRGASDIHLTPNESGADLHYRMDGSLIRVDQLPPEDRNHVVTRIKILSDMRIDVRHVPQGGRIVARWEGRKIDFRASTLPTQYGENVVLRILDSNSLLGSDLARLGMSKEIRDPLLEQSRRPQGIILVTGPTGSGKTTTLYHILNWLHQQFPHKSISTIENPIEYVLEGIVQSEVNEARKLTPAVILKEKLRQDPDVIMVGEIRNLEEGGLAFTAALTGHVVFSTLHTNDGACTIRRLVDMGLEPYNVSTAINCILSQRLAKRICPHCAVEYRPTEREAKLVRETVPDFDPARCDLRIGRGCDCCFHGTRGRVGIYELLVVTQKIKELISRNATDSEIRAAAVAEGMKTLRLAGLEQAFAGLTSLPEILGATDLMR